MFYYEVYLQDKGRSLTEEVKAASQSEARRKAERIHPGYKAGSAQQTGRVWLLHNIKGESTLSFLCAII